jgi:putative Holliday junction resolvase
MKYIGVAIGEKITNTARPLATLLANDGIPNWLLLNNLINVWKPYELVIGVSVLFYNNSQTINYSVKNFKKKLYNSYKIPIYEINEDFTTWEAKNIYGIYKKKKNINKINSYSASTILGDWLTIY